MFATTTVSWTGRSQPRMPVPGNVVSFAGIRGGGVLPLTG